MTFFRTNFFLATRFFPHKLEKKLCQEKEFECQEKEFSQQEKKVSPHYQEKISRQQTLFWTHTGQT